MSARKMRRARLDRRAQADGARGTAHGARDGCVCGPRVVISTVAERAARRDVLHAEWCPLLRSYEGADPDVPTGPLMIVPDEWEPSRERRADDPGRADRELVERPRARRDPRRGAPRRRVRGCASGGAGSPAISACSSRRRCDERAPRGCAALPAAQRSRCTRAPSARSATAGQPRTWTADELREHFARHPDANVGIRTGDRLVVLDIDPRAGGDREPRRARGRARPAARDTHRAHRRRTAASTATSARRPVRVEPDDRARGSSSRPTAGRWSRRRRSIQTRARLPLGSAAPSTRARSRRCPVGARARRRATARTPARRARRPNVHATTRPSTILASDYVPALTGRAVNRAATSQCPFHEPADGAHAETCTSRAEPTLWQCC